MRALALILISALVFATPARAQVPGSFADMADRLLPTVVNISTTAKPVTGTDELPMLEAPSNLPPGSPFEDFFENYMNRQQGGPLTESASLGSGFIIDAQKGLIITNNHVIKDAADVRVTLHDDSSFKAEVVGVDEKTDLALLKIDSKGAKLQQVDFGDSDVLRVGDWILAIGNPFGLGGTVTAGIVSARKRDINAGPYDDFIQTDASINRGNSGGPMFNLKGELIGINTAIFSPSGGSVGIGFAIPSNMARPVLNQLVAYGKTRRGWLGVKIQSVTPEIAESLGLTGAQGALIANVTKDGPGEKAGIKPYDILLSFNEKPLRQMRDLPRLVAEAEVGKPIPIELFRDGKTIKSTATLGELETAEEKGLVGNAPPPVEEPKAEPKAPAGLNFKALGMTIAPITAALTEKFGLVEGMTGVVVTHVADYSDAARKGLLPGDVIMEVNQSPLTAVADMTAALSQARTEKRNSLLMLVDRAGDERFVAIRIEAAKAAPKAAEPKAKKAE